MARHKRSSMLESRASRLRLPVAKKPVFVAIAPRVGLGYRRNQGVGTWIARGADGRGGYWTKAFAIADDNEDANGVSVLSFWQAQDRARALVRGNEVGERPVTVAEALDNYASDLRSRSGETANADRVRACLPPSLAAKTVTSRELRHWRDSLITVRGMKASSADRTGRMLKAALNLAARDDLRITNVAVWKTGLARLPEQEPPVNKIVSDQIVRKIVAQAYAVDLPFGLFVELAATTGARPSQLLRLTVGDLIYSDPAAPSLNMPSSRKGKRRHVSRHPLPIPPALAVKLKRHASGRTADEPLLQLRVGWKHGEKFRRLAARLNLDESVTLYSLRHSSIVRQLLAGVPVRIVAAGHDTSVVVLERVYSRFIGNVSDAVVRRSLIDTSEEGDA